MEALWNWLDGKKTYLGVLVLFLSGGARAVGWVTEEQFRVVEALGLGVVGFGLRSALGKVLRK